MQREIGKKKRKKKSHNLVRLFVVVASISFPDRGPSPSSRLSAQSHISRHHVCFSGSTRYIYSKVDASHAQMGVYVQTYFLIKISSPSGIGNVVGCAYLGRWDYEHKDGVV